MKKLHRGDFPVRKYLFGLFKDNKDLKGMDDRAAILSQYFDGDLRISVSECTYDEIPIGLADFSRAHTLGYEISSIDDAKYALLKKYKNKKFSVVDAMYKRYKKEVLRELNDSLFGRPSRNIEVFSKRYRNLFANGLFPKDIIEGSETWKQSQEKESFWLMPQGHE